jgi:transketolase
MDAKIEECEAIARRVRARVVEMSHRAGTPHLGSALSCIDLLVATYCSAARVDPKSPHAPDRDRVILSKGHAATALYATLCSRGFFGTELLDAYAEPGHNLPEQPAPGCAPGVELATGSLGHGLSVGIGMALAAKINKQSYRVFTILSDGECNEGSVWEAAMCAPAQRLGNIVAMIDFNKWQATGRSTEVTSLAPLKDKWTAFGWRALEIDGHDMREICSTLAKFEGHGEIPTAVIAHTVKGKGVSFMEDDNNWHYRIPTADELARAKVELGVS